MWAFRLQHHRGNYWMEDTMRGMCVTLGCIALLGMFAGCSQSRAGESSGDVQASGTTVDDVGGVSSDGADVTDSSDGADVTDSSDGADGQDGLSSTDNTGSDGTSSSEDCDPDCPSGQVCKDGACEQPIICEPGTYVCDGLTAKKQCNTTGLVFSSQNSVGRATVFFGTMRSQM